jgi:tetratricopeptide (TPR) repeat protein
MNLKLFEEAHTSFDKALNLYHNEQTLIQIGKLFVMQGELKSAIDKYVEALEYFTRFYIG